MRRNTIFFMKILKISLLRCLGAPPCFQPFYKFASWISYSFLKGSAHERKNLLLWEPVLSFSSSFPLRREEKKRNRRVACPERIPGCGCSKLTMLLVNVSFKFQMLLSYANIFC